MQGYIKLHRKLLKNPIFKNYKLLQTFLYCLLNASHKEHEQLIGEQIVKLLPGQLATGRKAISSGTGLSEQNVRTALTTLQKLSILTIKPTTKYSVISIANWNEHQIDNQQLTSSQPTTNQQLTTNKNVNNVKNGKNKEIIDFSVLNMTNDQVADLKRIRIKNKGTSLTQRIVNALAKEFEKGKLSGFTFEELFTEWEVRGWKSLKAEWMPAKTTGGFNGQYQQPNQQMCNNERQLRQAAAYSEQIQQEIAGIEAEEAELRAGQNNDESMGFIEH